jgi:uncharacterized membrane-anchored protein
MLNQSPHSSRTPFHFWLPLALQTLLIAAVPAQAIYTQMTGKTVVLKTAPVDPYDVLRGYYTILSYDISQANTFKKLPGWKELPKAEWNKDALDHGLIVYVTLERPPVATQATQQATQKTAQQAATNPAPEPWKPIAISQTRPENLPDHQISLQGKVDHGRIIYGLETYYMPESRRDEVNDTIAQNQRLANRPKTKTKPMVVEIKVDDQGKATPVQLWLEGKSFQF